MKAGWDVIRRCPDCNDQGQLPDGTDCTHQPVYITAAEKGAAAARAAVLRPKLPTTTGEPS